MVYSRRLGLSLMVASLGMVGVARGAVIQDFEGAYTGAGTVEVDPADAGNHVLFLNNSQLATFATSGTAGVVTMRIYDFGDYVPPVTTPATSVYGPRWGVSDTASSGSASAAVAIINRSGLPDTAGYGMEGPDTTKTGSWFSPVFFAGPRQVVSLDDPTTVGTDEGSGKWSTWTFDVGADGKVKISVSGIGTTKTSGTVATTQAVTSMTAIWIYGGTNSAAAISPGVLVDDVTFTPAAAPEPASLTLLGIGGLMLLRRRRR